MKQAEVTAILEEWRAAVQPLDYAMSRFRGVTDAAPESVLCAAVSGVANALMLQVAARVGFTDEAQVECLSDWWLTHEFGRWPMGVAVNGEPRSLRDSADMAWFISAGADEPA